MTDEANDKIVFALVGGLGDRTPQGDHQGPQLSLHTSADRDISDEALNTVLDRFTTAFQRQRDRAEMERIRDHILGCERMIKDAYASEAPAVAKYNDERRVINEKIELGRVNAVAALSKAEKAYLEGGRAGPFKPDERPSSPYGALKKAETQFHIDLANLDLRQSESMRTVKATVESHESSIKQAEEHLARLEARINPPKTAKRATG